MMVQILANILKLFRTWLWVYRRFLSVPGNFSGKIDFRTQLCRIGVLNNFAKFKKILCAKMSFLIKPATLLKKRLQHGCFQWIYEIFKNTYFVKHLPTTVASIIFSIAINVTPTTLITTPSKLIPIKVFWIFTKLSEGYSQPCQTSQCVKSVTIWSFSCPYFPEFGLNMEKCMERYFLSQFKYGKTLRTRTLFTQYLKWYIFAKTVNGFQSLKVFAKS